MKICGLEKQVVTASGVQIIQDDLPQSYRLALIGLCHTFPSQLSFRLEKKQLEILDEIDVKLVKANGEVELAVEDVALLKLIAQHVKSGPQYMAICRFLEGETKNA